MSNYGKPERPGNVPEWAYADAEVVNGTGQTLMWMHDDRCDEAGGGTECCTGDLECQTKHMDWRGMEALAWWMLEQANIARWHQLREACMRG